MSAAAQEDASYPIIRRLDNRDPVFAQLQDDIRRFHRRSSRSEPLPPLAFFGYRTAHGDDFYGVSARLNLRHGTLASINGISRPAELREGDLLVVPNTPGLFVPVNPESELEYVMAAVHETFLRGAPVVTVSSARSRRFYYLSGREFSRLELAFFRGHLFRFPLPKGAVSSRFGMRESPISGRPMFHSGIDIAAPAGTAVMAAREGVVTAVGTDLVLGRFIVVEHEAGYESMYGHLDRIDVVLNQTVGSGSIIGTVGNTGLTTGPHLHFELRSRGDPADPLRFLPGDL